MRLMNGKLKVKEDHFIDAWDESRLIEVAEELRACTTKGGIVVGAFQTENCVGFTAIEPEIFGSRSQYQELTMCHITRELRGKGFGKQLFQKTVELAQAQNIEKLYVSTHPAVETQAFYQAMGCVLAEEINKEILAREPLDIQLEFHL